MKLKDLIMILGNPEVNGEVEVSGIAYDSRRVAPGTLFVAIRGLVKDGHEFIPDAISRGASAIVVEESVEQLPVTNFQLPVLHVPDSRKALAQLSSHFYGEPSKKMKMVGITGTNGKTTTSYLLASILKKSGMKTGLIGTIDYWTGEGKRKAEKTTPESLDLQEILSEMRSSNLKAVVMEVSSHALAMKRTFGIEFETCLFTNLSRDHLDFHQTMEQYAQAKMILFEGLSKGKRAILNFDDTFSEEIRKKTKAEVTTFGFKKGADFQGVHPSLHLEGTEMKVLWKRGEADLRSPLIGRPNLYNLLSAFTFGILEGFPVETVLEGIEGVREVPGRLEAIDVGQSFKVFVDYAHTPDALEKVLLALKELTGGRIIVLFGCGGDRDRGKRPMMARVGTTLAHFTILTSDNPRSEDPRAILKEMEEGVVGRSFVMILDRREAIQRGIEMVEEGDVLLIAGKGHEGYQIIGEERFPFDDREVARENLKKKKWQ